MIIECEERYQEAMDYAKKTGDKTLQNCLDRMKSWEKNGDTIYLYKDFAPLSFYFEEISKEGRRKLNGGLIYHGSPDQSLSITMNPTIGWQIHT